MKRDRWKSIERDWAEALGGRRVPVTGRQRGDVPDVEHPLFSVEIKGGQRLVSSRVQLGLEQAKAAASGNGKLPLVGLDQSRLGPKGNLKLVVMERADFLKLLAALHIDKEMVKEYASIAADEQWEPVRALMEQLGRGQV